MGEKMSRRPRLSGLVIEGGAGGAALGPGDAIVTSLAGVGVPATPRRGLCVMKALSVPGCRGEPISEFAEGDQIILLRLPRKPLLRGETGVLEPAASSSDLRGENI
tara:strand:- start:567 stop:884 length:318 start_codon:yes stop_codon:yes gene_type:complete